jgi:hypothetical protein
MTGQVSECIKTFEQARIVWEKAIPLASLPETKALIEVHIAGTYNNADFHGRENNQLFWTWKPRFLGEFAISVLESLIVYPAQNDSIGIKSTLAVS